MKKKIISVIILAAMLAGCAKTVSETPEQTNIITESTAAEETDSPANAEDTESVSETISETVTETEASVSSVSEEELRTLMEQNLDCMRYIFSLGTLAYSGDPVQGDSVYKVDDRFSTFAELEEYVRGVYCREEADRLLYNYPYEGEPLYFDVDGALCIDANRAGAKGYYVDWTDFGLTINSADDTMCEFTVTGLMEEPAEEPVYVEYKADARAVCEDGKWVLEKMIY